VSIFVDLSVLACTCMSARQRAYFTSLAYSKHLNTGMVLIRVKAKAVVRTHYGWR